jgi:hypothetical protein
MAMNAVVTSHLPVCLYSAAGGKVNRQVARTRANSHLHPLNGGPLPAVWWATSRLEYFNRFSATSPGKVFFGPSAFRSLEEFSRIKLVTKNDLAPRRATVGACFVAEGPLRRNTFERSAYNQTQREGTYEATIQGASA